MKILIDTTNPSKVKRFENILGDKNLTFLTLRDLSIREEPSECGKTPKENASLKAAFYGEYFDTVICNDSGLYFSEIPFSDSRQPGLHVRTPRGVRLSDEEMISYYSALVTSLGGCVTAYYLDGFSVYRKGKIFSYQNEEMAKSSSFLMKNVVSPHRHIGWPLDSLSYHAKTGKCFAEDRGDYYCEEEEQIIVAHYRDLLKDFLKHSLDL